MSVSVVIVGVVEVWWRCGEWFGGVVNGSVMEVW
jgi:hypothetical protein